LLPAVAGYDADGALVVGEAGLDDAGAIGSDVLLSDPGGVDPRGLALADRLAALIDAARRRLIGLTGRLVTHAVVVVPRDGDTGARMLLLQAVEAGGLDVLRLIEPDEAEAEAAAPGGRGAVLGAAFVAEDMQ
jgi:hypothetical protein